MKTFKTRPSNRKAQVAPSRHEELSTRESQGLKKDKKDTECRVTATADRIHGQSNQPTPPQSPTTSALDNSTLESPIATKAVFFAPSPGRVSAYALTRLLPYRG